MVLTAAQTAHAGEASTAGSSNAQMQNVAPENVEPDTVPFRLSQLPMRLNPQIGVSNFEYSAEGASKPKLAGGATVEFGAGTYHAETGLLVIQRASQASIKGQPSATLIQSNLLAIPLMAKIQVYSSPVQSWSLKLGAIQTYELSSNKAEATNKIDVLGSVGFSGRLAFTRRADFIVDASYNRGFIPALRAAHEDTYNEGVLVLAGVSFRL
jgi:hypothetical protein